VALDPGTAKCGVAVLSASGEVLARAIVPLGILAETLEPYAGSHPRVLVGNGTGALRVMEMLRQAGWTDTQAVEEKGTTLDARRLYWQARPPRGWLRLIPRSFLVPPRPIDDWAAVAIGLRYFASHPADGG
jgi:hypothetical protein